MFGRVFFCAAEKNNFVKMYRKKGLKMCEIMAILEASDSDSDDEAMNIQASDNINVVYVPPNVDENSDNEHIAEDEMCRVDNVDANLRMDIAGTVELEYDNHLLPDAVEEVEVRAAECVRVVPVVSNFKKVTEFGVPKWTRSAPTYDKEPVNVESVHCEKIAKDIGNLSPYELFSKFLDTQMYDYMLEQTHKYAQQKLDHAFVLQPWELKRFIGILFLSGYNTRPEIRSYWNLSPDQSCPIVSQAMSRNRFVEWISTIMHWPITVLRSVVKSGGGPSSSIPSEI